MCSNISRCSGSALVAIFRHSWACSRYSEIFFMRIPPSDYREEHRKHEKSSVRFINQLLSTATPQLLLISRVAFKQSESEEVAYEFRNPALLGKGGGM